jgi:hypothetical protein
MSHDGGDPPAWLGDGTGIMVDLDALSGVADTMQSELAGNLVPSAQHVSRQYGAGVRFGVTTPSLDVHAAMRQYRTCVDQMNEQLNSYIQASGTLIDVARRILDRYATADALAKASANDVDNAFAEALAKASAAQRHVSGRPI